MGNWAIVIRGVGSHHNKRYAQDANRMTAGFVKELKDAGHHVSSATFTHGSEDDITHPSDYLELRDKYEKEDFSVSREPS